METQTYIDANQVDLGVTVLARLGGGHVDDLARAAWRQKYGWDRIYSALIKREDGTTHP